MKDEKKFKLLAAFAFFLCLLAVSYNIAAEYVLPDIESRIQRKRYYESAIEKKGLTLRRAEYWREGK